jgi:Aspartyl protease
MPVFNQFLYAGAQAAPLPSPDALVMAGAFLSVDVSVPPVIATALTTAGQPVPPSQTGLALIDTGATMTCVHEPLLTSLGLHPVGTVRSGTAAGQTQQAVYMARLVFPLIGWTVDLQLVGVDLSGQTIAVAPPGAQSQPPAQPVVALLGRNLLRFCNLIWNGSGGFWTISY